MASSSGSRHRRAAAPPKRRRLARWFWALWLLLMVWLGVEYARLPDVSSLAKERPGTTAMMRERAEENGKVRRQRQHWVELGRVAPHAVNAVLVSEDARFYEHAGIDGFELAASIDKAVEKRKLPRGASTITQQLARNLYYGSDRSLLRKAREAIVARRLEQALDKRRILTLYLNIAEWGDGVWGIEAAARTHFGVSASRLTVAQGAMLASMLPAPTTWTPRKRPALVRKRAGRVVARLERTGKITAAQAAAARAELGLKRKAAPEVDPEIEEREEREELEELNVARKATSSSPAAGPSVAAPDRETGKSASAPDIVEASDSAAPELPAPGEVGAPDANDEGVEVAPSEALPVEAGATQEPH